MNYKQCVYDNIYVNITRRKIKKYAKLMGMSFFFRNVNWIYKALSRGNHHIGIRKYQRNQSKYTIMHIIVCLFLFVIYKNIIFLLFLSAIVFIFADIRCIYMKCIYTKEHHREIVISHFVYENIATQWIYYVGIEDLYTLYLHHLNRSHLNVLNLLLILWH